MATALAEQVEQLALTPAPDPACPCFIVVDADDPFTCRNCKAPFRSVLEMQRDLETVLSIVEVEQSKLVEFNAKEDAAKESARMLGERVEELVKLADSKGEEQSKLQLDLQKMGEKIIEEIEKRAEIQVSRDTLQDELEELTKSLFEEANVMVADEARKRHAHETREKSLEQELAEIKLQLQMEQLQLRELQIKMEEQSRAAAVAATAKPITSGSSSAAISRASSQSALASFSIHDVIDPVLLHEFRDFLKHGPTVKLNKLHTLPFMKNVLEDDVTPCLRFGGNPRTSTKRLIEAILMNSCFVEEMSSAQITALQFQHLCLKEASDTGSATALKTSNSNRRAPVLDPEKAVVISASAASVSTPTQAIFQKTVLERWSTTWSITSSATTAVVIPPSIVIDGCSTCGKIGPTSHHFKISEQSDDTWCSICSACHDRLVSVCEFYNFVRHLRQGLYSTRRHEDLFQEVLTLKRKMFFARMGAHGYLPAEMPFNARQMLRPDSQLLREYEMVQAGAALGLERERVGAGSSSGTSSITGSPGLSRITMGAVMKRMNEEPALAPSRLK